MPDESTQAARRRLHRPARRRIQFLAGLAVSLALLALAFRGVSWPDLRQALQRIEWAPVAVAIAFLFLSLLARAARWRLLLAPLAPVSLADSLSYLLIGYLVNNVVPFRLGEVVRAGLLGEKLHTGKAGAFATVVLERLLDTLSLLAFVTVLLFVPNAPAALRGSIALAEAVAVLAVALLGWAAWRGVSPERLVPRFVTGKVRSRLVALLGSFLGGLQVLRQGRHVLAAVLWSLAVWAIFVLSVAFFLRATGLNQLPWPAAVFLVVVTNLGTAIPTSPGSVGSFHFLAVYSLTFWSAAKGDAVAAAIIVHGVDYLVVTGLGALALWRENIAFGQLGRRVRPEPAPGPPEEAG